ncbi:lysozyme inhibitor LprI family protein [Ruegeria arenilitoris]|uniref:lysozyme inhibitor LprI family protein n=1 Tax=Ruegeria arenilitoris TaxID=1173585 RepID=UPI00147ED468|nr:lysozyme inhibitor LprI family protein [Ruegeria arenilitoris]
MKKLVLSAILSLSSFGVAQAFEAEDYLHLHSCSYEDLEQCAEAQLNECMYAAEGYDLHFQAHRASCAHAFSEQADVVLNDFYQLVLLKTKIIERELGDTAYIGQEKLLRNSQRAWLEVRDTTCELNVLYGAIYRGYDTAVVGCLGRMTVRRVADLQNEIGSYLD